MSNKDNYTGEQLFKLWSELGNLTRVSTQTGLKAQEIRTSVSEYVIENPDTCRPIYDADRQKYNNFAPVTDKEWNIFLIRSAINTVFFDNAAKFLDWVKRHNIQDWEHAYRQHFKKEPPKS